MSPKALFSQNNYSFLYHAYFKYYLCHSRVMKEFQQKSHIYISIFLKFIVYLSCLFLSKFKALIWRPEEEQMCEVLPCSAGHWLPLTIMESKAFCFLLLCNKCGIELPDTRKQMYFFLLKGDNVFILGKGGMFGTEGCPRESLTVRLGTHHNGRSCPTVYLHTIQALMLLERYCSESLSHGRSWPWGKKNS